MIVSQVPLQHRPHKQKSLGLGCKSIARPLLTLLSPPPCSDGSGGSSPVREERASIQSGREMMFHPHSAHLQAGGGWQLCGLQCAPHGNLSLHKSGSRNRNSTFTADGEQNTAPRRQLASNGPELLKPRWFRAHGIAWAR